MTIKRLGCALVLLLCASLAIGAEESKAQQMVKDFGAIRKAMILETCNALGYNNQAVLGKLKDSEVNSFHSALKNEKDTNQVAKQLYYIIGDALKKVAFKGEDVNVNYNSIKLFKKQLNDAFSESRINTITDLLPGAAQGRTAAERKKAFSEALDKYDSKIDDLVAKYKQPDEGAAGGESGGVVTWESVDKTPESVVEFIKSNPVEPYLEKADDWLWRNIEKDNQEDIVKYKVTLPDGKHIEEANKKLIEIEQEKQLKACKDWSDYDRLLQKWENAGNYEEFRKKVDKELWDYCQQQDEPEIYKKYLVIFGEDGLYYKPAKSAAEGKKNDNAGVILIVVLAIGAFLLAKTRKKKGSKKDQVTVMESKPAPAPAPQPKPESKPAPGSEPAPKPEPSPKPEPTPGPEPVPVSEPAPSEKGSNEWVVVGASVQGNGHKESNVPCQDNSKFLVMDNGWGVAIVSDGAGSAAHSEIGSKVVVERGVFHFKALIEKEGWMRNNVLPTDAEWLQKSYFVLKAIRDEVEMVANKNNVPLKSLSATCLVVIFSPIGLLATHIGDGRMGCKTAAGWKAIMTPHKGEEANQTIFLVSDFWDIPNYVQSGVLVPESVVVREPVTAFTLMSDGCESTSWLCTARDSETGHYFDQNKPFEGFFNPLEETLVSFAEDQVPEDERQGKWAKFIESGAKGFVREQDDKTMILGVFVAK